MDLHTHVVKYSDDCNALSKKIEDLDKELEAELELNTKLKQNSRY